LTSYEEKEHYQNHQNNSSDSDYRAFVQPVTNAVLQYFNNQHIGLDFGSGKDAAVVAVLKERGYQIHAYDPFFLPNFNWEYQKFDFITATEVVEHLHHPLQTFEKLRDALKPNGKLFLMTELLQTETSFANWYYKNDPTHVTFYSVKTIQWLADYLGFSEIITQKRLVVLGL
jgi:cyclopropane fatty-acyl-phospholipid synthase-like methyltransferase